MHSFPLRPRMSYKLKRRTFTTSHIAAIARVYGEDGDEILQHLKRNPAAVLPVVIKRLKQKDEEWRQVRAELNKVRDCVKSCYTSHNPFP